MVKPHLVFDFDIKREIRRGNYFTAVCMAHDFMQGMLYNLLSTGSMYLGLFKEATKYQRASANLSTLNKSKHT